MLHSVTVYRYSFRKMLAPETISRLVESSIQVKKNAYTPYSKFPVGAAVLGKNGTVYRGCCLDNAAYPLSICAEKSAIVNAVSEGCKEFEAIAIAADADCYISPCGSCRQVMAEFGTDYHVILCKPDKTYKIVTVGDLLPLPFSDKQLKAA